MSQLTSAVISIVLIGPDALSISGGVYFIEDGKQQLMQVECSREIKWSNRDVVDEIQNACETVANEVERLFNKGEYIRDSGPAL